MAPSAVNDGMRQVQADIREWFNDAEWILYGDGDGAFALSFASATSFTIAGINVTGKYHVGRRVKATGALTGTIYGSISSSSFSTNTVVNVEWDSGSLQNEAITVYLGILSATNQAIPSAFNGGITGEIRMFAGSTAPSGWLLLDGSAVLRTTYAALFALIGTTYGAGDGSTTFNVPNAKGRVLAGRDAGQTEFDTLGETGGAKTHALTTAELASHTHGSGTLAGTTNSAGGHQHNISVVNNTGGSAGDHFAAQNGAYNDTNTDGVATDGAHTHTVAVNSGATASAGSSTAHNNLQPYLVVNYIIKT